jgi:hypothetical protein
MPLTGPLLSLPQKCSNGRWHWGHQPTWVVTKEGASLTQSLLAAVALLALARCAMSNDIGPLAVGAVQDLEDHCVTR